ncbi:MAG: hypothetical protein C5B59_13715 [Bacteroidetes bacterium]|nr:MAG: hypothetical protein C5B59_13715 [Bacteroidota bacterium]
MSSSYPNDVLRSPTEVEILALPSLYATAIASHGTCHEQINLTDFNQNYESTMFPVPAARLWSGNEVRSPNMTSYTPYGPKPSVFGAYFRAALFKVQSVLQGTP